MALRSQPLPTHAPRVVMPERSVEDVAREGNAARIEEGLTDPWHATKRGAACAVRCVSEAARAWAP